MTYDIRLDLSSRLRHAVVRRLRRIPYVEHLIRRRHRVARAAHVDKLPWLGSPMSELCQELNETGLAQVPLTGLGLPLDATLQQADALVDALRSRSAVDSHFELTSDEDLLEHPEPYLFGLSHPLLDLAERYMGLPVDYLGVQVKREIANGEQVGTRLWHADPEDDRMLKIIVYLSDVDEGSGPFAAVDANLTTRAIRALRYDWGTNCTTESLERVVPYAHWRRCTGPKLTAIFCDTARCLHRASPPTTTDRYSMTFSYLSRRAYFCFSEGRELQQQFVARWASMLDERQLDAVVRPSAADTARGNRSRARRREQASGPVPASRSS